MKIDSIRRRVETHDFPTWDQTKPKSTPAGIINLISAILLFALIICIFVFFWYVKLFEQNLNVLIALFKKERVKIPLLISLIVVIFFFPFSLIIILLGLLTAVLKN